jgi:hypothetical protein
MLQGIHDALLLPVTSAGYAAQRSSGLAASLAAPELGVATAIVLLLGRAYLLSQAESITEQIQEFSVRLINALIDRPDVRLGHR